MTGLLDDLAGQDVPVRIRIVRQGSAGAGQQVWVEGVLDDLEDAERRARPFAFQSRVIVSDRSMGAHDDLEGHLVAAVVGQLAEHVVADLPVIQPAVVDRADRDLRQADLAGTGGEGEDAVVIDGRRNREEIRHAGDIDVHDFEADVLVLLVRTGIDVGRPLTRVGTRVRSTSTSAAPGLKLGGSLIGATQMRYVAGWDHACPSVTRYVKKSDTHAPPGRLPSRVL